MKSEERKMKKEKRGMLERFPVLFFTFSLLPFLLSNCNNFFHDLVPPDDNRIESFSVDGQVSVEIGENTITAYVSSGTDPTNLKTLIPSISVSKGATLFPVTYEYVSRAFGDDRTFGAAMQLYTGGVDKLVDLIRANKDSFAVPVLDLSIDFSYPVDFLVISALGTIRQYKVSVEIDTGEGKFKSFKFDKFYNPEVVITATGVIVLDIDADIRTVTVNVSYPVENIASYQLTPSFETFNNARVYLDGTEWKSNETLVDFLKPPDSSDLSNPDYATQTKILTLKRTGYADTVWTLIVNFSEDPDTDNRITDFRFTKALNPLINADYVATIYNLSNGTTGFIDITVYYSGTMPEELRASFISPGTVTVNGDLQRSGYSMQSAQDFSKELQYTVTSNIGGLVRTYYVWVDFISAADPLPQITNFSFRTEQNPSLVSSSTAIVDHNARLILIEAAYDGDTPPYNLRPQFTANGGTVTVNDITQRSGITSVDFSSPVWYVVTNSSNPTLKREYRVEVQFVRSLSSGAEIYTYSFYKADNPDLVADIHATVNQTTGAISATLFFETSSSGDHVLVPRWTSQGRIESDGVPQISGEPWQFYTPQGYHVSSADGLFQKDYTVTVKEVNSRIYVKHDATGRNDGSSWENAYTNLPKACADATLFVSNYNYVLREVWIAEGTYTPSDRGNVSDTLPAAPNTSYIGGFRGNETSISARVDPASHRPVITGDLGGGLRAKQIFNDFTSYETVFSEGVVYGFEDLLITSAGDGTVSGVGIHIGGGNLGNSGKTAILKGLEFSDLICERGAVGIWSSDTTITDCSFTNTSNQGLSSSWAYGGAVVFVGRAWTGEKTNRITINRCSFTNTWAAGRAGALYLSSCISATVTNCSFNNTRSGENYGHAIVFSGCDSRTQTGNTFTNVPSPQVSILN